VIKNNEERLILEDYQNDFSYEKKSKLNITFNRIAFIFFAFLIICTIYSIKVFYLGSLNKKTKIEKLSKIKKNYRVDILDNNGNFIAKAVNTQRAGINPKSIIDKEKLIITLKAMFKEKDFRYVEKKIIDQRYFRLRGRFNQNEIEKLRLIGDKSIRFEEQITRLYPQENLFSHIIGQIDDANQGISGIEKSFDYELKTRNEPLQLTVDTDIQFLIREELIKFQEIFRNIGSAAILMNVNNGNILSMVSLPDFNLNKREEIEDVNYINRASKGVYELGSVFKTFTIAAGLNEGVIEIDTEFKDLPKRLNCEKYTIREYDEKIPSNLTAEQILIRSGNIGSVRIAQRVGLEKFASFLESLGLLSKIDFDIEEVGQPKSFRWGKCKLATASFGHGINTTPLQLAKGYSIIANGGFDIKPTLIKKRKQNLKKNRILKKGVSDTLNKSLRKIVLATEGTANFANIKGYEVGGKTGTAQKSFNGKYSRKKINTFSAIFPTSRPKYVLVVLLDEPKTNSEYIYYYKDGSGRTQTGTPFNTAGWTAVEVAGKIIEKIGPILATKYTEVN